MGRKPIAWNDGRTSYWHVVATTLERLTRQYLYKGAVGERLDRFPTRISAATSIDTCADSKAFVDGCLPDKLLLQSFYKRKITFHLLRWRG